jgi:hypothetical protein
MITVDRYELQDVIKMSETKMTRFVNMIGGIFLTLGVPA